MQGGSLETFSVTNVEVNTDMTDSFSSMSALCELALVIKQSHGGILRLVTRPLRHLKLGSPDKVLGTYLRGRPDVPKETELMRFDEVLDTDDPLEPLLENFGCLESLELMGITLWLDISKTAEKWTQRMLRPSLKRLVIESCAHVTSCFEELIKLSKTQHELREFVFRHEAPGRDKVQKCLNTFLRGFGGLSLISVLLDNSESMRDLEDCLKTHGSTLRQLVWECRKCPRVSRTEATSVPLRWPEVRTICRLCPSLREISVPLSRDGAIESLTYIFQLSQLRTIQVRNSFLGTGLDEEQEIKNMPFKAERCSLKFSYRYATDLMSELNHRIASNSTHEDAQCEGSYRYWTKTRSF